MRVCVSIHARGLAARRPGAGRVVRGHAPGRRPHAARQGRGEVAPPGHRRVIQDSSDEEDSSNDSEAADTLEAGRF